MTVLQNVVPNWGEDYRGVSGGTDQPTQMQMGDMSNVASTPTDAMDGLTSDGSSMFNDTLDDRSTVGEMEAMQGVANNALDATLLDTDMYLSIIPGPHANDLPNFDIEYPVGSELQPGNEQQ
jgi:hypothetical protein